MNTLALNLFVSLFLTAISVNNTRGVALVRRVSVFGSGETLPSTQSCGTSEITHLAWVNCRPQVTSHTHTQCMHAC